MLSKSLVVLWGCALLAGAVLAVAGTTIPIPRPEVWGQLALFGGGWLFLATLVVVYGVTHLEAGRASIILLLELVVAVFSVVLTGAETVNAREWAGGALILSAALLEARPPMPPRPVPG